MEHHRVVVVGSGFAGLGMAIELRKAGELDFVVLEKASDLGGTWRDNTYPGCQCDVPSNLYSFSFAPNPKWSRSFAWQKEILEYLHECANRFGVRPHIRFDTELIGASWDEATQRWRIETSRGPLTADVIVSGHGGLSAPSVPELPGLERFRGTLFHSAEWRHDQDLTGKRIGVVGTGASAIQIVPSIQPRAGELVVFQRTPAWVMPRMDRPLSERQKRWFGRFPLLQRLHRFFLYWVRELIVLGMTRAPWILRVGERLAAAHLRAQVKDPVLRKKLAPRYAFGCKRILLSDEYYPALTQPNARLVTEGVREVTENGVVTSDGAFVELDALVLCTGFRVTNHPVLERIRGRDGRSIAEHWTERGAAAYLGTTVPGFPNFFTLSGPHTGVGHTSLVFMIESQFPYVIGALAALRARDAASVEVRADVAERFTATMHSMLDGSVWNSGCASWYLDAKGQNTTIWPTFSFRYREKLRRFDDAAYCFEARRVSLPAEAPERAAA